VSEDGVAAAGLGPDSISVGQEITVSGEANVNTTTGQPLSLDAGAGQVRLGSSSIWGTLNSATAGAASLDLLGLGDFSSSTFDFAGTGTTSANDATAANYQVATGSLNESAVPAGTLLQMNGIATPFGSAPPDFQATSVTQASTTAQQVVIEWSNAAAASAPFTSYDSTGVVVNLANTALSPTLHDIRTGPTSIDIATLPASPAFKITTVGANQSNLVLAVGSAALTTGVSVFNTAAGFAAGLHKALNGTNRVFRLVAYGQYDSSTNSFIASRIYVALQETI
jgi:LysM repeat protein